MLHVAILSFFGCDFEGGVYSCQDFGMVRQLTKIVRMISINSEI